MSEQVREQSNVLIPLYKRLCEKIFRLAKQLPYPGELKNIIRTSIVFSNPEKQNEYVINLAKALCPEISLDRVILKKLGFSLREMEVLTGISKSKLAREENGDKTE